MTLSEIATQIGISILNLNTANDADGKPTDWLRHWENSTRVAVSIHKETLAALKADPTCSTLSVQTESRTAEQGDYTSYRIVKHVEAEHKLVLA